MSGDKKVEAYETWTGTLPVATREALRVSPEDQPARQSGDDCTADYGHWGNTLPRGTREEVSRQKSPAVGEVAPKAGETRYGLVECPDGEWGNVRLFKTAAGLAGRIGNLEGQDVVVWAFRGVPIPVTKGPQRHLLLPDGATALTVPTRRGEKPREIDANLLRDVLAIQEDGFLGRPELAESRDPQWNVDAHEPPADEDGDEEDPD